MRIVARLGLLGLLSVASSAGIYGCSEQVPDGGGSGSSSSSSGAASSSSGESTSSSSSSSSSGGSSSSSSSGDGGESLLPTTCEGDCRTLTLKITNGEVISTFDRVQFGFNKDGSLHVEAHRGGVAQCPFEGMADPDHTFIMFSPRPVAPGPLDKEDGAGGGFIDLKGDVFEEFPAPKITSIAIQPVAASLDQASPDSFYAYDVRAEFAQGAVIEGHGFAAYCESMNER